MDVYEKEMDLSGPTGPGGDGGFHRDWRRSGDALVERAAADVVRMAANHLLARSRNAGSVPDPVRRLRSFGSDRSNSRRRMAERWERMTPEEREKFGGGMRSTREPADGAA